MKQLIFSDGKTTVKRITKQAAKKAYESGKRVLFCPNKLRPLHKYWGLDIWEQINQWGQYDTFETLCNHYSYYCCNSETGYYIAFYIEQEA